MAQATKVYDFKSVGLQQDKFQENFIDTQLSTPVGILTPVSFAQYGGAGSVFAMSTDLQVQIADNLRNLLVTNHGERLMLTDFGANLRPLAFELTSNTGIDEALMRISSAVSKFMPFVELQEFEPKVEKAENGDIIQVAIRVGYSIPSIQVTGQQVKVVLVVTS